MNGAPGPAGSNGTSGSSGANGSSGTSGANGSSGASIYTSPLNPLTEAPITVGGFPAGTTVGSLTGQSYNNLIDELLFPTVNPTYTIPTLLISSPIGLSQEIGSIISPDLTLIGAKNDAGAFTLLNILRGTVISTTSSPTTGLTTNISDQFGFPDPNNPNYNYSLLYTDGYTIPSTATVTPSSTVYNGNGSYNIGLTKKTNKGVFDVRPFLIRSSSNSQASATGFNSNSITINGWYPYFYGKSSSSVSASNVVSIIQSGFGFSKVIGNAANTITGLAFNAVGEWLWFATFSPFPTKTKWLDANNALNSGNIGLIIGGPNPDLFNAPAILPINSADGYWNGINYKIYVAQKVTTAGTYQVSVV